MEEARVQDLATRLRSALGDQFEIGDLLGAGGFAAVFRGRDPVLGRDVAIKVLDPGLVPSQTPLTPLLDEARLVATIEHPHIVPLFEAGERNGIVYLVMRYFPEGTLTQRIAREGRLPAPDVARLGTEIADALSAAHGRGVVHLDIKPDNILLDAHAHAAVADFGIARAVSAQVSEGPGLVSGTPHYMSPEQIAGDVVDGRSDVYALGAVLYQLASGRLPITGDTARQVMANHMRSAPAPLPTLVPEFPTPLAEVIAKALAKDPEQRWQTMAEMAEALRAATIPERLLTPQQVRRRSRRRWYRRVALLLGGIGLGFAAIMYFLVRLFTAMGSGDPPALDALGPLIPAPVADSLRATGEIPTRDSLRYVFIPHGAGPRDALVVTNREIVALPGGRPHHYPLADHPVVNLDFRNTRGWLVISPTKGARPDTIYRDLTGVEQSALLSMLRRVLVSPSS